MPLARLHPWILIASIWLLVAWQPAHAQGKSLVVTGGTLIDGTGAAARPGASILIRDGVVVAVTDADDASVPDGAVVIDASGKYIIPGLADMHVHFGTGGLQSNEPGTVERLLHQFLFYGVTTVLNVGATGGSVDDIRRWRRLQAEGRLLGPTIYATGGLLTVPGSHPIATIMHVPEGVDATTYDWSQRGIWVVDTPDEVRDVVGRLAAARMDGVKLVIESGPPPFGDDHPQMPAPMVAAAVEEANLHQLPVFAHTSSIDELEVALDNGVGGIMHLVKDPTTPDDALLARMVAQGTYYVPTLSLHVWTGTWGNPSDHLTDPFLTSAVDAGTIASLLDSPLAPKQPPTDDDLAWRKGVLQGLKAAHDAGVKIVGGSDTANPFVFPGYSMHHELELMVEAGLTPMDALVAATRRAAEMIGAQDSFGTLVPGQRADLLVLAADPLQDIRNTRTLETVISNGAVIDRSSLLTE